MSIAGDTVLCVRGLRKGYGREVILAGVDLAVSRGEMLAVVGPSGGGKSTLLRCVNGLLPFDAGEVHVAGCTLGPQPTRRAALRASAKVRRAVGLVFQDFRLFPHHTALDNIAEAPIHVQGVAPAEARERARTLLARVGLEARAGHYPHQLSGGQQQRVAIARALAMDPVVLLCDEITSALDAGSRADVLAILDDLRAEGLALVLVTHELGVARRHATRVAVLVDGTVAEDGAPEAVLEAPRHPRVQRFLEASR